VNLTISHQISGKILWKISPENSHFVGYLSYGILITSREIHAYANSICHEKHRRLVCHTCQPRVLA
jgi:hypothetical protein